MDTYRSFTVMPSVGATARVDAPSGPGAGQIAAQQQGQLGQAVEQAGATGARLATDMALQASQAQAQDIDIDATAKLALLQFHPDTGFQRKQGADPMKALGEYQDKAKQVLTDAQAAATSPMAREAVGRVVAARVASAQQAMLAHAGEQFQHYRVQTSKSRATTSMQAGALDYRNEDAFQGNLGTAQMEAENQGAMQGWDAATVKLEQQKYQDDAYRLRYDAWRAADPVGALQSFQKNASAISPAVRVQMYHQLFEAAAPGLAQQLNATGGPGVVPPADGQPGPQPRGVRNNNPGNLIRSATPWDGEVQGNDPRYASFAAPEAGIRAMGKTLLAYQDRHGVNTVAGIVTRWAPASESGNNPAAYAKTVATLAGVQPGDAIDLHDPATLDKVTRGIITVENGKQPFTDQQIALGLASATGGAPLPAPTTPNVHDAWRNPGAPTGNAVIDALPSDFKMHVLMTAKAQAASGMAEARDALRGKVQDAAAAYMTNGTAPNPPALAEFVQAYGQNDGVAQFSSFQGIARLGQQLQQVKTLPANDLAALVARSKPVPGPGFADAERNYETLTQAVDRTTQMRQRDPVGYAQATGAYGVGKLPDITQAPAMLAELDRRALAAPRMSGDYGVAPSVFSKPEAQALAATIKAAPVEAQKQYLGTITKGLADINLIKSAMQAIAPDQPVLAMAGLYQGRGLRTTEGRDVADLLLRGQAILTPNKQTDGTGHDGGASLIKMPQEKDLLDNFNARTGDAFADRTQSRDLFMQGARAIYAAKSAEAGDYSGVINPSRWNAAIDLATGGLHDHNGSKIVMPYGWGYDQFTAALSKQAAQVAPSVLAAKPDEIMRMPLVNFGDGQYLVKRGAGYLVTKDGRPLVLKVGAQ